METVPGNQIAQVTLGRFNEVTAVAAVHGYTQLVRREAIGLHILGLSYPLIDSR
jgi:hypothetical protein